MDGKATLVDEGPVLVSPFDIICFPFNTIDTDRRLPSLDQRKSIDARQFLGHAGGQ